jgi:hypothetical protein
MQQQPKHVLLLAMVRWQRPKPVAALRWQEAGMRWRETGMRWQEPGTCWQEARHDWTHS